MRRERITPARCVARTRCGQPAPDPLLHPRRSLFFKREMELSLIGLQNAGKSSLVNVLTTGQFHEDMIPTVRGGWGDGEIGEIGVMGRWGG